MRDWVYESAAVAGAEVRKLLRDPTELFARALQPVLWLALFGQVFSQVRGIPTGDLRYLDYLTPGILAQSTLFSAMEAGDPGNPDCGAPWISANSNSNLSAQA